MSKVYNQNPKFEIVKESRDWREKDYCSDGDVKDLVSWEYKR